MTTLKLYLTLEDIILRNIWSSYNANTPPSSFNIYTKEVDASQAVTLANFNLEFEKKGSYSGFKISKWRLPSTRIYFSRLSSQYFSISEVSFFDFSLIIARSIDAENTVSFKINKLASGSVLYGLNNSSLDASGYFTLKKDITFQAYIKHSASLKKDVLQYLPEIIKNEKNLNPVSKLHNSDKKYLENIDMIWSSCSFFDSTGLVRDFNNDHTKIKKLLLGELKNYIDFDYNGNIKNDNTNNSYFYSIIGNDQQACSESTKQNIQEFWNDLSLPSRKAFLAKLFKDKPEEITSFLILVFFNGFWWSQQAKEYLDTYLYLLPREIKNLYSLLFELKTRLNFTNFKNAFYFKQALNDTNHNISFTQNTIFIKQNKKKNIYLFQYRIAKHSIKLDKKAQVSFQKEKKEWLIKPEIYSYNFNCEKCTIAIDDEKCTIYLGWDKFNINVGKVRFKFLFKKDRYQISTKVPKWIAKIKLNDAVIDFEKGQYQKTYLEVKKRPYKMSINFFDHMGRLKDINNLDTFGKDIGIHALVQNRYGHLSETCTIQKAGSKKNLNFSSMQNPPQKLAIPASFTILNPKSQSLELSVLYKDSLLHKIKNTDAYVLENQLAVFLEDIKHAKSITAAFNACFDFNVNVFPLEVLKETFYRFNIIICDAESVSGELIKSESFHEEIQLKKQANKRVVVVQNKNIDRWLRKVFFQL